MVKQGSPAVWSESPSHAGMGTRRPLLERMRLPGSRSPLPLGLGDAHTFQARKGSPAVQLLSSCLKESHHQVDLFALAQSSQTTRIFASLPGGLFRSVSQKAWLVFPGSGTHWHIQGIWGPVIARWHQQTTSESPVSHDKVLRIHLVQMIHALASGALGEMDSELQGTLGATSHPHSCRTAALGRVLSWLLASCPTTC